MDIIESIRQTTDRIAKLEEQLDEERVNRAAQFAAAIDPDAETPRSMTQVGAAVGISRQYIQKAIRDLGPGTPRARVVARARAKRS